MKIVGTECQKSHETLGHIHPLQSGTLAEEQAQIQIGIMHLRRTTYLEKKVSCTTDLSVEPEGNNKEQVDQE